MSAPTPSVRRRAPAAQISPWSRRPASWPDLVTTAAAAALLALFWWMAVSASLEKSHTSDELPHITAGYAFNRFGDFRMHPENGVLPQRLFGLPAQFMDVRFPIDDTLWRRSTYWQIGWDFFYGLNNPTEWLILCARALNALLGVILGGFIFARARAWRGRAAGLLALGFFVFSPNFLAHAALATSDLAATLMLTVAPWCFWRHLERRDLISGIMAAGTTGLAFVAKFNGLLIVPIFGALALADAQWRTTPGERRMQRLAQNVGLGILQAAAAISVIWLFFNFRFSARGPGTPELVQYAWNWSEMLAMIGWKRSVVEMAVRWQLLPEAWLYGLTNVLAGEAARPAFFAGEHSMRGWWQFFPALVLLKTPLPALLAFATGALAAGLTLVRADRDERRATLLRALPLVATAALVWLTAITSNLNIGDRHILAVYPVLILATASLARGWRWLLAGGILLGAQAWTSLASRPHYLASFNSLAGGPAHAYRLFVDSSLDWGQDLPALREWLAHHRREAEKVYLGYFGSAWPPYYGVRPTHFLPAANYLARPPLVPYELAPGLYCISATVLSEVYSVDRGPWTPSQESEYQRLRRQFEQGNGGAAGPAEPGYRRFDELRFARLCKYLHGRAPDTSAGHSILIFRLSDEELRTALTGPVNSRHRLRPP